MQDLDPAGVGREARDRHEVNGHIDLGNRAREVGEEDERTLQDAHEYDAVGMIARDLAAEAPDVCFDRRLVQEDRRRHVRCYHVSC